MPASAAALAASSAPGSTETRESKRYLSAKPAPVVDRAEDWQALYREPLSHATCDNRYLYLARILSAS